MESILDNVRWDRVAAATLLGAALLGTALLAGSCSRDATASPVAERPALGRTVGAHGERSLAADPSSATRPLGVPPHFLSPEEERWGVEVLGVTRTSAGYMLDLRYRVVDPDKAAPLLARGVRTRLVDEATGAEHFVPNAPKVGPLRQTTTRPRAGQTYFALFANPGKALASGALVTILLGDFELPHVAIR